MSLGPRPVVGTVLACAIYFIAIALLRRMRKGRFQVQLDHPGVFAFSTNFGAFKIDHTRKLLSVGPTDTKTIPLVDIASVNYHHHNGGTPLFRGGGVDWYTIIIRLKDGKEFPVFVAGEYLPRQFLSEESELLMGRWLDLEYVILQRLGLSKDVSEYARSILGRILSELQKSDPDIQLK